MWWLWEQLVLLPLSCLLKLWRGKHTICSSGRARRGLKKSEKLVSQYVCMYVCASILYNLNIFHIPCSWSGLCMFVTKPFHLFPLASHVRTTMVLQLQRIWAWRKVQRIRIWRNGIEIMIVIVTRNCLRTTNKYKHTWSLCNDRHWYHGRVQRSFMSILRYKEWRFMAFKTWHQHVAEGDPVRLCCKLDIIDVKVEFGMGVCFVVSAAVATTRMKVTPCVTQVFRSWGLWMVCVTRKLHGWHAGAGTARVAWTGSTAV